jgi:biopolymer transport protein ExbD
MKANKPEDRKGITEINLTSLVDVSLTLVIIFMVSSPFVMQSGIKVSTPKLEKARTDILASELKAEIHIHSDGGISLNNYPLEGMVLGDSLKVLLAASESKAVLISADDAVIHDQVIAVMDAAKQCGAQKLSLVKRK